MTDQQATFLEYAETHWLCAITGEDLYGVWIWLFRWAGMPV